MSSPGSSLSLDTRLFKPLMTGGSSDISIEPVGKVLITGITGFVGPYLAKSLLNHGYEVYGLVRRRAEGISYTRLKEARILDQVKLIEGDLTDLTSLLIALDKAEPDIIFHLGAQSFIPRSFKNSLETFLVNSLGTQNILEAVRLKDMDSKIVFAGSSEEYGLQISSQKHYEWSTQRYGRIIPEPSRIPELPIDENNPLRPLSPYAVSKVHGDYLMRNYWISYGLKTVVSRAFNHEGAGRGPYFVLYTGQHGDKLLLILAPKFLYYAPAATLMAAGITLLLAALLRANLGYSPGIHSSILGGMMTILGYNLAFTGLAIDIRLAAIFGKPTNRLTATLIRRFNVEKAMLAGVLTAAAGVAYLLLKWVESGYRYIPLRGENVVALTLFVIGVQIIFYAFSLHLFSSASRI